MMKAILTNKFMYSLTSFVIILYIVGMAATRSSETLVSHRNSNWHHNAEEFKLYTLKRQKHCTYHTA
jgi:hypothetical protein